MQFTGAIAPCFFVEKTKKAGAFRACASSGARSGENIVEKEEKMPKKGVF